MDLKKALTKSRLGKYLGINAHIIEPAKSTGSIISHLSVRPSRIDLGKPLQGFFRNLA